MAVSDNTTDLPPDISLQAKHGITLLINNHEAEAKELFKSNLENIQMSAGYAFVIFLDALMSFEEEKLQLALVRLRETEKKCATDIGWIKSVRSKVFGYKSEGLADRLESQIILADTQVCIALITFLQQEFSGYLKGGWILRKAWKIYQQTYDEIRELYKKTIGNFNLPEPTDFEWADSNTDAKSSPSSENLEQPEEEWFIPSLSNTSLSKSPKTNGYVPISSPDHKNNIPHSQSTYIFSKTSNFFPFSIKRSGSAHSSLTTKSKSENNKSTFSLFSPLSSHLSLLSSTFSLLTSSYNDGQNIDPANVARLMGAVCFGYGVLQLGISLLPPSVLKFTNFLGFAANRTAGISNLMYARQGTDMRAPLAMLTLLWYHTIVRPFYALDGNNVKAGIESANLLLQEAQEEYEESALFLFFKGRIFRLDGNLPHALESFQAAATNSTQREIKLLALHEVGWCYLIQLDFIEAEKVFIKLRHGSRWSKPFYYYLTVICLEANSKRNFSSIEEMRNFYKDNNKTNQLDMYIQKRLQIFPSTEEELLETSDLYWKLFLYELIYLWNALPSCNLSSLDTIIQDCEMVREHPMLGLPQLIQGACYNILDNYEQAVISLRKCIQIRSEVTSTYDLHISACAEYTLGVLLLKDPLTQEEGTEMLKQCSNYKDYDFANKLLVRINMALRNVS